MAKTVKDKVDFRALLSNIRQQKFAPVYILSGSEPYYLDVLTQVLEESVVDEADRDFNQMTFFGSECEIEAVVAAARQLPVMAPRQLIILKESQGMSNAKSQLDKLVPYIENPNRQTVLVIVFKGEELRATSKIIKAANLSDAIVFESPLYRDYQLNMPIKEYCASKKIQIDDKAVALLCENIGNPLSKLFGEIDKLIISLGGGSVKITAEDIERNIGISKDFNTFELVKAFSVRDFAKALLIVDYFKNNPNQNPLIKIVPSLYKYFSDLTDVLFLEHKTDESMMDALDVKRPFFLTDVKNGMRNYNARQAVQIIHLLRKLDCKSKGIDSFQNGHSLLKEFVYEAFTI